MTKMAFNPLPWFLTADGFHPELAPPLEERLREIKLAGYDGVHAEVPEAMTVEEYRALLDDAGLLPAPGYFQWAFSQPDTIDDAVSKASTDAAQHAELGLDRMFLADAAFAPERFATPSRGVDRDSKRTARIANGIERVARAMVAEGVVPCLHQHVGTWIEASDEVEQILEIVPDDVLLLGPDTGHLAWAGADVVEFITRHRPRIGAVHLKDIRLDVATQGHLAKKDYLQTAGVSLWTEPGRGDLDFDAVLDALGNFDGWFIVEVDVADQPTVAETAKVAADWLRPRLERRSPE